MSNRYPQPWRLSTANKLTLTCTDPLRHGQHMTNRPHLAVALLPHHRQQGVRPRRAVLLLCLALAALIPLLLLTLSATGGSPATLLTHLPTSLDKTWSPHQPTATAPPPAHAARTHAPPDSASRPRIVDRSKPPVSRSTPTPAYALPPATSRWAWPLPGRPEVVRGFDPPDVPWGSGHRGVDLAPRSRPTAGRPTPNPNDPTGQHEAAGRSDAAGSNGSLPAGTQVLAAGAGVVSYAAILAGRGVVVIQHVDGLRTTYEPVTATVQVGQHLQRGDVLGTLVPGHPGCPRVTCLHWGLRRGSTYLNPLLLIGGSGPIRLLPRTNPAGNPQPGTGPGSSSADQAGAAAHAGSGARPGPEAQSEARPNAAVSPGATGPSTAAASAPSDGVGRIHTEMTLLVAVGGVALIAAVTRRPPL